MRWIKTIIKRAGEYCMGKSRITINGNTFEVDGNSTINVHNNSITVNGKELIGGLSGIVEVKLEGDVRDISSGSSITVKGNVYGNVDAGNSATISGDVAGNVDAGNSVHCGNVEGSVDAGNSIYRR